MRALPACLASALLLVVGWSALWLFARGEAISGFDGWLAAERDHGRLWTCADRKVTGYPLAVRLACDQVTFQGPVADGVFQGHLARLSAAANLYQPTRVDISLGSPLALSEIAGSRTLNLAWADASLMLRGTLPSDLGRGSLILEHVVVDGPEPQPRIGHVEVAFRPVTRQGDGRADLELVLKIADVQVAQADALFGSNDPLSFSAQGMITQVAFDGAATASELLGPWTAAGGQVHIENFLLGKGAFRAVGDGRFGLDEEHRLDGRVEARFRGIDPVAARYGIPIGVVQAGGLIAAMLGSKTAGAPADPAEIAFPVTAKNGRVSLGPFKTGLVLRPLY